MFREIAPLKVPFFSVFSSTPGRGIGFGRRRLCFASFVFDQTSQRKESAIIASRYSETPHRDFSGSRFRQ